MKQHHYLKYFFPTEKFISYNEFHDKCVVPFMKLFKIILIINLKKFEIHIILKEHPAIEKGIFTKKQEKVFIISLNQSKVSPFPKILIKKSTI